MKKKWMLKGSNFSNLKYLTEKFKISAETAKVLAGRGLKDMMQIESFLKPSFSDLHSPWLLKDMEVGVSIIAAAIANKERIIVFGDYDADGVMSTAILYKALKYCGALVHYYIPDRISEGYGMSTEAIEKLARGGANTIISCDNGIAAFEQVKRAKELGITVIITDHHEIPISIDAEGNKSALLPNADAIINPKQKDCSYPFKGICGAMLALKFSQALYEYMNKSAIPNEFYEFAAIATVCDVMELIDENRFLVQKGLLQLQSTANIGLAALLQVTKLKDKKLNTFSLGFIIGPCINASSRLDSADIACELLITEDNEQAKILAEKLYELNNQRKYMTLKAFESTANIIEEKHKKDKVLVVYNDEIEESIAGIVAGRIKEKYCLPTIVITKAHEDLKGSARSIEGYNMFEELSKCRNLMSKFGGHPMAAGLSLKENALEELRSRLNNNFNLKEEDMIPILRIDLSLPVEKATLQLAKELKLLEPYGNGNGVPLFGDRNLKIEKAEVLGKNKNAIRLSLKTEKDRLIRAICFEDLSTFEDFIIDNFGKGKLQDCYAGNGKDILVDIVYALEENEYNGRSDAQIQIKDIRPSNK